jgi:hypothetical protein
MRMWSLFARRGGRGGGAGEVERRDGNVGAGANKPDVSMLAEYGEDTRVERDGVGGGIRGGRGGPVADSVPEDPEAGIP